MDWLWKLLTPILSALFSVVSPLIRDELKKLIRGLYQSALNTSSAIDDMAVKLLADLLSIDVSDIHATVATAVTSLPSKTDA